MKDFAPYVAKMKAAGADTVITGNWGNDMSLLIKAAKDPDDARAKMLARLWPAKIVGKLLERCARQMRTRLGTLTPAQYFKANGSFTVTAQYEPPPGQRPSADIARVGSDYFRAMGVRVLEERPYEIRREGGASVWLPTKTARRSGGGVTRSACSFSGALMAVQEKATAISLFHLGGNLGYL